MDLPRIKPSKQRRPKWNLIVVVHFRDVTGKAKKNTLLHAYHGERPLQSAVEVFALHTAWWKIPEYGSDSEFGA